MHTGSARFSAIAIVLLAPALRGQLPPDKALASMEPAADLTVTLFAAEPDVVNPSCFDIDPQGRVWVCEGVNYRGKASPPHRKTGDRIVVLEDADGDGRCDRSRVFCEGLDLETPLGICHLGDRILLSQSPWTRSIEIRPDGTAGEKKDFLVGFGGRNHDHGVHSYVLGPDGLLYCAFGNSGARVKDPDGRRLTTDGNPFHGGMVFRCALDGTGLEGLAHNFRNNYECALDSFGTIFQSDNDDDGNQWVRFCYVQQGGNYGYVGRTGRHWAQEKKSHWHMEDPGVAPILVRTGGGSPTGLCVYEGDLLPERLRGMPIHVDAGPRVVQVFKIAPLGAGYHVAEAPLDENGRQTVETLSRIVRPEVLLTSPDTWFRPSDVAVAPDGSLFISDWYDPGVGGHGMGDTTRGRIYRLVPKGRKAGAAPPFDLTSREGLSRALASPCLSTRSLAQLRLRLMGREALPILEELAKTPSAAIVARALWILGSLEEGRGLVQEALSSSDPRLRILAIRCLKRTQRESFVESVGGLLKDADPQVRREILLELRDVEGDAAMQTIADLALQYDGQDRFYLAAIGIAARTRENALLAAIVKKVPSGWSQTLSEILWETHPSDAGPHLARLISASTTPEGDRLAMARALAEMQGESPALALAGLLKKGGDPPLLREIAGLIVERIDSSWAFLRRRTELAEGTRAILESAGCEEAGLRLAAAGRIAALRPSIESIARDGKVPIERRSIAIEALGAIGDRGSVLLLTEIASGEPQAAAIAATLALGRMSGSEPQDSLRKILLETGNAELRSAAVKSLAETKSGALVLIQLARDGTLPETARSLATTVAHSSGYEDVRLLAQKELPRPRSSGGKEVPPLKDLLVRKGDPERGRRAFFDERRGDCGRCHRVQKKGTDIGPELSAIGSKHGAQGLYESILSPSAAISHEYRVWILQTKSAGLVSGTIVEETDEKVTLRDANGKRIGFEKSDVIGRTSSEASLMPEGLVGAMTVDDLVNIVEFLLAQKQPLEPGSKE